MSSKWVDIGSVNEVSESEPLAVFVEGFAIAVVRCGESADGLPIAVQVVARPFREDIALAAAKRLEEEFGGWKAPALIAH